jgi:multidrug efflux pump subunit AcrA (membrane-fusion protein)
MTWLGKTLAVAAAVLALVWMWLTASAYATRTNWKAVADQYKEAYTKARDAREAEYRVYQAELEGVRKQAAAEQSLAAARAAQVNDLRASTNDYTAQIGNLNAALQKSDVDAKQLQTSLQAAQDQLRGTRERADALQEEKVQLVAKAEQAKKDQLQAEIATRAAESERQVALGQVDTLRSQLDDIRNRGGRLGGAPLPGQAAVVPPPERLRGTVTEVDKNGYVTISVGLDAGLATGQTLDLSREAAGKYLGRLKVTRVYPKEAVAQFLPADATRTPAQLRPDDLPKKGDTVKSGGR